jgi:hypothetical protein
VPACVAAIRRNGSFRFHTVRVHAVDRHLGAALEAVGYEVGGTVRHAGGRDSDCLGVEARYSW